MTLANLIEQLRSELNLPELAPQDNGAWMISFDSVDVGFVPGPEPGSIVLMTQLGFGSPGDVELLQALMEDNLRPPWCVSGALAMAPDGSVVLLRRFELVDLDYPRFLEALGRFVDRAQAWQRRLPASAPAQALQGEPA